MVSSVECSKLHLPQSPSSPPQILSANYDPNSLSLSLTHPNSSISLFSPLSQSPPSLTPIPPPVSSSTFLHLHDQNPRVLFVVVSPFKSGASICLKFYALRKKGSDVFSVIKVICNHKDFIFDEKLGAVVMKVNHGVSVRLCGDVNVFSMYVASSNRIWVFAVKMVSDEVLKLMKCAVVECNMPVWSVEVSFGYLILGEDDGVRVFLLRPLVKGKSVAYDGKYKGAKVKGKPVERLPNGVIRGYTGGSVMTGNFKKLIDSHEVEQKNDTEHHYVKVKSVKVGHEAGIFKSLNVVNLALSESKDTQKTTAKAISIKAMSANKFLILDSLGNLHLLSFSKLVGSKLNLQMRQLDQFMKVQKLAVLRGTQTFWISDGFHTVRMMTMTNIDPAENESGENVNDDKPTVSGNHAIFTSEKIKDVVSLSENAVLIFGQDRVSFSFVFVSGLVDNFLMGLCGELELYALSLNSAGIVSCFQWPLKSL